MTVPSEDSLQETAPDVPASSGGPYHPTDVHIGRRLRTRRLISGLSQMEVGDALGVAFQQIQKYEYGLNRASAFRLWQLSVILKCSVRVFFEGLSRMPVSPGASDREIPRRQTPEEDQVEIQSRKLVRVFQRIKAAEMRGHLLRLAVSLSEPPRAPDEDKRH